ncbi:MAG: hypothetical protein PHU85_10780, partial [Phycisphaerae bacterium]|nr:hypothetical protein [Phycisphaerae bacterium]
LERDYVSLLKRFGDLKAENQKNPTRGVKAYVEPLIEYLQGQIRLQELAAGMATTRPDVSDIMAEAQRITGTALGKPVEPLYQATGVLRPSEALGKSVSMPNLHKLETTDGLKVICYVVPPENADWSNLVGKQVTVAGKRQFKPEWNFYLVRPEQIVPAGEVITSKAIDNTGAPPIRVLPATQPEDYDPSIFPIPVIGEKNPTTAPDTRVEPKRSGLDILPPDRPVAPEPKLAPVAPPTTQGGN